MEETLSDQLSDKSWQPALSVRDEQACYSEPSFGTRSQVSSMNVKEKPPIGDMLPQVVTETPTKQSVKQRTIKEIEAEVNSIKKTCGIPTQEGINSMFSKIDHQVQTIKDATNTFLNGDRSEERVREGEDIKSSGHTNYLSSLENEKGCPREQTDELLQSTAVGSVDHETLNGKRQRPFFNIEPKNLFQSEASKRVRFDDECSTTKPGQQEKRTKE